MTDILPFLKTMLSAPGLSGDEGPIRSIIAETWQPLVDDLQISRLGSLHGLHKGRDHEPRPRILLAAHMDAIGLMVTRIVDGFIAFTEIGGVDHRILPGQMVTVHGQEDLPGMVVQPPTKLLPPHTGSGPIPMNLLWIDTGLLPEQVSAQVTIGDRVSFAQLPTELGGEILAGHSLDNRASVAAVTVCLQELQHRKHIWDVWAAATVQEEETLGGAITSSFAVRPDIAVAIDVTFAKGPGSSDWRTFALGKGVTLSWGPNISPAVFDRFKEIADRLEIPYTVELAPRHSGTDAYAMQVTAEGIPTMVLSIPLRYMHTPVEVVSIKDIQRAGRLLAEFISSLEPDFINNIQWDKEA